MGSGSVPPDLLVQLNQLGRYNVPSDFLSQFVPRPFLVQVTTPGALGTMQFEWQRIGDPSLSAPVVSSGGASWLCTIDDAFADLTFPAGTYVLGSTYTIDTAGNITPSADGLPTLTALLFDLRQNACSAATTEAMMRMRDAIHPPLITWGDDATTHAAAMAYAILKRGRGATPNGAGAGDDQVFLAETRALEFFDAIGKNGKPDSMTDSSPSLDGPLIPAYPSGDPLRGW